MNTALESDLKVLDGEFCVEVTASVVNRDGALV